MTTKAVLLLFIFSSIFLNDNQTGLPIKIADSKIKPLTELSDFSMQKSLEKELNANPTWKKLISQKKPDFIRFFFTFKSL